MRQKKLEIKDRVAIEKILNASRIGRLGTNGSDGFPYITPLNYVYWRESIYLHCALAGEKLDNIMRDPRVCFEVDFPLAYLDTGYDKDMEVCDVSQFYQSVIIRGRAEIVEEMDEKVGALNALMASHENNAAFSEITADMRAVALCRVIAIRIESLSAKANLAQKKTPEEKQKICRYLQDRNSSGDIEAVQLIRG